MYGVMLRIGGASARSCEANEEIRGDDSVEFGLMCNVHAARDLGCHQSRSSRLIPSEAIRVIVSFV